MKERLQLVSKERVGVETWGNTDKKEGFNLDIVTEEYVRNNFSSAGVLPLSTDGQQILLGAHDVEGQFLWGPFAGRKLKGEQPEDTAGREALEELGVRAILNPPTILINAAVPEPKTGVIFPIQLTGSEKLNIPNEEIDKVEWFGWGKVVELMDTYNPSYNLWGNVPTWQLLNGWLDRRQRAIRTNKEVIECMAGVEVVEAFFFGQVPYERLSEQSNSF